MVLSPGTSNEEMVTVRTATAKTSFFQVDGCFSFAGGCFYFLLRGTHIDLLFSQLISLQGPPAYNHFGHGVVVSGVDTRTRTVVVFVSSLQAIGGLFDFPTAGEF